MKTRIADPGETAGARGHMPLLSAHGYRRVHEQLSEFDDWYVLDDA